jgi:8-hydroxy-5-deazaflavin:NADPH oxidoreductase
VVDVSNRMGEGGPGSVVDGSSNAEAIQAKIPGATVVKAFNTVFSARQADPNIGGLALDGYVAGAGDAKQAVLDLVGSIGLEPVDAGPLESARILEAMASLAIWRNLQGGSWRNGWKLLEP